jgi:hypothetical protein
MKLTPEDIRDMNWEQMQEHVGGLRASALAAFREHGPGTTRQVAARAGWELLSLRPRATELLQLGFLELVGRENHEGVYLARSDAEVRGRMERDAEARRRPAEQMALAIGD